MQIVILSKDDYRMLIQRYLKYGNSTPKMIAQLKGRRRIKDAKQLESLNELEEEFNVDLGTVSYKFLYKDESTTPPMEKLVLNYVASWGSNVGSKPNANQSITSSQSKPSNGDSNLLINIDRVHEVMDLVSNRVDLNPPAMSDGG